MRIGVLGGGQLGRMLALAGFPLGLRFLFQDPALETPAHLLAEQIVGPYEDEDGHHRLAEHVDLVTYELETVPAAALYHLAEHRSVFPSPRALQVMQDRVREKRLCEALDIPVPWFRKVDTLADLEAAAAKLGYPLMLKTRYAGYDGRGQRVVRVAADLRPAFETLGGRLLIAEALVPFEREVSLVAVRGRDGSFLAYPLIENCHQEGILRWSRPVVGDTAPEERQATDYARRVAEHFGYVGVLTLEFFVVDGSLLVNEMAPRVHNSGHWTIEGAVTSQFENHLRAGLGWPLGATTARGPSVMVNLVGDLPDVGRVLAVPGAHLHVYGKAPRPGRKVGHVTIVAADAASLAARWSAIASVLGDPEAGAASTSRVASAEQLAQPAVCGES